MLLKKHGWDHGEDYFPYFYDEENGENEGDEGDEVDEEDDRISL